MSVRELWAIFDKKQRRPEAIGLGEAFPFAHMQGMAEASEYERARYIVFLSLYCSICMELLPSLQQLEASRTAQIILCTNGTDEENRAIKEHFRFPFPVWSVQDKEMEDVYYIQATPFVYATAEDGSVIGYRSLDEYEELVAFMADLER